MRCRAAAGKAEDGTAGASGRNSAMRARNALRPGFSAAFSCRFTTRKIAMAAFAYDHVHLRSPDPEETARYYERMFGATIIRSKQSDGRERIDLDLCGLSVFIARAEPDKVGAPPQPPFQGLEHLGLRVSGIDAAAAELKRQGAEFTMEPTTIRPGVRIAFLRGPQNVHIELVDRNAG
jgi:catechol 2,3-dioxygenase-like lactoylglutathione lyase family enzyme